LFFCHQKHYHAPNFAIFIYSTAQKGRRHNCLRSTVNLLGLGSIFVIGAIAGFHLKSSPGPQVPSEASSSALVNLIPAPRLSGAALLSVNTEVLDWRDVNNCELMALGKEYDDDKFYHHIFGDLYCENFIPFRNSRSKLRMLEIGFGCGHHNHGRSAQGKTTCRLNCVQPIPQLTNSITFTFCSMEEIFHREQWTRSGFVRS
jgi:hypothetical protein